MEIFTSSERHNSASQIRSVNAATTAAKLADENFSPPSQLIPSALVNKDAEVLLVFTTIWAGDMRSGTRMVLVDDERKASSLL